MKFDHSLTIFFFSNGVRTCSLVSTDAAFEDASVGPEVHSFARIERACSKWPPSACETRGARRPIEMMKKKKGDDGGAAQRARQVCSEGQGAQWHKAASSTHNCC